MNNLTEIDLQIAFDNAVFGWEKENVIDQAQRLGLYDLVIKLEKQYLKEAREHKENLS